MPILKKYQFFWIKKKFPILSRFWYFFKGTYPLSLAKLNLKLKARNPKTFTQKILHKMAYDRNPNMTLFADKARVKEFIKARVGEEYVIKTFLVVETLVGLKQGDFPRNFVVKANNGSGASVIVWEGAPATNMLPRHVNISEAWKTYQIHPDSLNFELLTKMADGWMKQNYYYFPGKFPEWAYLNIKPLIVFEELQLDKTGKIPSDFRFYMFHGKCKLIQVEFDSYGVHTRNFYSEEFEKLDVTQMYPNNINGIEKPIELDEMFRVSERLSEDADFLRVDFYLTLNGLKVGELTNYPLGGGQKFSPKSFGKHLGRHLDI